MANQVAFVVYKDQDQFKGNVQFSVESVDIDSMLDCTYSVLYHDFNLYLQGNSIEKKKMAKITHVAYESLTVF